MGWYENSNFMNDIVCWGHYSLANRLMALDLKRDKKSSLENEGVQFQNCNHTIYVVFINVIIIISSHFLLLTLKFFIIHGHFELASTESQVLGPLNPSFYYVNCSTGLLNAWSIIETNIKYPMPRTGINFNLYNLKNLFMFRSIFLSYKFLWN